MQIERRLAPFWRGLEDHSSSWTEPQIIAAARGNPIPAPDEVPPEDNSPTPFDIGATPGQTSSIPIGGASRAAPGDVTLDLPSPSLGVTSSSVPTPSSSNPFRHRTKSIATAAFSKSANTSEPPRQEFQLPADAYVNGQRIEVYLYKETQDCPICFRDYPPFLNRTRCCDQPICSECFVQIKRPDPHPPEHLDPNTAPPEPQAPFEEDSQLVSEPSTCPFCKASEFGVSYEPPPFRRGLAYAISGVPGGISRTQSGMSSTSSLEHNSPGGTPAPRRRRGQSLSVNAPSVITTDTIRPDWAKKLADARSQAARRSAAATALHTAAFMMGNSGSSHGPLSRRRARAGTEDSNGGRDDSTTNFEQIMAALARQDRAHSNPDLFPGRGSSRSHSNAQDFEQMMIAEAIRQSLAEEEDRRKKDEKQRAKEEKQKAKEEKKASKTGRKNSLFSLSGNSSGALLSDNRPTSPAAVVGPTGDSSADSSKGKARTSSGIAEPSAYRPTPLELPTSTINAESYGHNDPRLAGAEAQQHLSQRRAEVNASMRHTEASTPGAASTQPGNAVNEPSAHNSTTSTSSPQPALPPYLATEIRRGDEAETQPLESAHGTSYDPKRGGDVSLFETNHQSAH